VDALLPRGTDARLSQALDELRLVKDEWELDRLQHACDATARGFADVARELPRVVGRPDLRGERWLEGTFWRRARLEGNEVGYTSIVGSGAHATTLH
jgi:Xaa-Pro aminopeptidase